MYVTTHRYAAQRTMGRRPYGEHYRRLITTIRGTPGVAHRSYFTGNEFTFCFWILCLDGFYTHADHYQRGMGYTYVVLFCTGVAGANGRLQLLTNR